MRILTAKEMRAVDKRAIEELGIPSLVLMENAGVAVVRELEQRYMPLSDRRIDILVGTGNNGGDGLVIARHLLNRRARVRVFLIGSEDKLTPETAHNLAVLRRLDGDITIVDNDKSLARLRLCLSMADMTIDSLLGIGVVGPLRGLIAQVVELVNGSACPVISVDMPTGVNATNGEVSGQAVRADLTITLAFRKLGLCLYPGAEYAGEVQVADIGIPEHLAEIQRYRTDESVKGWLAPRRPWGHKGTYGHVLVIAGAYGMTGAALLASRAALRSGAGMVTLAVPESVAVHFPSEEIMVRPIPDAGRGSFGKISLLPLKDLFAGRDVLILGPGLGRSPETVEVILSILTDWPGPLVLDADGLNALEGQEQLIQEVPADVRAKWIFTPHPGEMSRLTGLTAAEVDRRRVPVCWDTANKWGNCVLLKGAPTVVSDGQRMFVNSTGNPGMGTAGMGDVLSGIIGGLASQGLGALEAAALGAYVHGQAGDLFAQQQGMRGLIASDIIDLLPKCLG